MSSRGENMEKLAWILYLSYWLIASTVESSLKRALQEMKKTRGQNQDKKKRNRPSKQT